MAEILKPEYVSSEESEVDEENANSVIKYKIHRLPWESRELRRAKRKLERLHRESLSGLIYGEELFPVRSAKALYMVAQTEHIPYRMDWIQRMEIRICHFNQGFVTCQCTYYIVRELYNFGGNYEWVYY